MWWSCFDYYNQEHIHNRTIKRLRLWNHLQKDRSQKTAHICYTLIDKSVYNRFTIYQVDPQREPAPKTEHPWTATLQCTVRPHLALVKEVVLPIRSESNEKKLATMGCTSLALIWCRWPGRREIFSSEWGQNIPVLPVGLRKVEMYRFCGNNNEESF